MKSDSYNNKIVKNAQNILLACNRFISRSNLFHIVCHCFSWSRGFGWHFAIHLVVIINIIIINFCHWLFIFSFTPFIYKLIGIIIIESLDFDMVFFPNVVRFISFIGKWSQILYDICRRNFLSFWKIFSCKILRPVFNYYGRLNAILSWPAFEKYLYKRKKIYFFI